MTKLSNEPYVRLVSSIFSRFAHWNLLIKVHIYSILWDHPSLYEQRNEFADALLISHRRLFSSNLPAFFGRNLNFILIRYGKFFTLTFHILQFFPLRRSRDRNDRQFTHVSSDLSRLRRRKTLFKKSVKPAKNKREQKYGCRPTVFVCRGNWTFRRWNLKVVSWTLKVIETIPSLLERTCSWVDEILDF